MTERSIKKAPEVKPWVRRMAAVRGFLTWLAVERKVSAATRNQALSALRRLHPGDHGNRGGGIQAKHAQRSDDRGAAGGEGRDAHGAAALLPPNERSRTIGPPQAPAPATGVSPLRTVQLTAPIKTPGDQ